MFWRQLFSGPLTLKVKDVDFVIKGAVQQLAYVTTDWKLSLGFSAFILGGKKNLIIQTLIGEKCPIIQSFIAL